jgi:hypothetical protein
VWTPLSIAALNRLRQPAVWIPPIALSLFYFASSSIHSSVQALRPRALLDFVAVTLMVGWLVAATGSRDPLRSPESEASNFYSCGLLRSLLFTSMTVLGRTAADATVGVGGMALLALAPGAPAGSPFQEVLLLVAAAPAFAAASLQMEIARRFAPRPVALLLTALVAMATVVHAASASTFGLDLAGGLLFPVSAAARAAEEPLGLKLAVRAAMPGALYDLALLATLLALRPMGVRACHEDRDRQ